MLTTSKAFMRNIPEPGDVMGVEVVHTMITSRLKQHIALPELLLYQLLALPDMLPFALLCHM